MMTSCENIFEAYRNADFMNRLHIYLQFPELRDYFLKIDQTETGKDPFASISRPQRGRSGLRKFITQRLERYTGLPNLIGAFRTHK